MITVIYSAQHDIATYSVKIDVFKHLISVPLSAVRIAGDRYQSYNI